MRLNRRFRSILRSKLWFFVPSMAGVGVFLVIPFLDVTRRSFTTAVSGEFCGIQNYRSIFANDAFRLAAVNTLRFTVVCLPLLIICSLIIATALSASRLSGLMKSALLFPMAVPTAVVVLVWKMLFFKEGLFNNVLLLLHQQPVDFMGSDAAFFVLIISYIWKNTGYTVVLWMAGLANIPDSMLEASRVDGASELRCFFSMILPNLKPVFYTIGILSFLNSFKVFREAYLVAGAYPQDKIYLLQHLFNNWFGRLEADKMSAAAVCIALVFGGIAAFMKKALDALKGE